MIERGWLIERRIGPQPTWAKADDTGFSWTPDSLQAIRFSRRSDAEQVAAILGDDADAIVTDHQWGPDPGSEMNLAREAYEAYANHTGWKSLATGSPLPQWADLSDAIRSAWMVSTAWVVGRVLREHGVMA